MFSMVCILQMLPWTIRYAALKQSKACANQYFVIHAIKKHIIEVQKLEFCTFPRVRVPEKGMVYWCYMDECMWMHHDFYCVGSIFFVSAMLLAYTLGGACGACALHFVFRWLLCKRMCPGTESHEGLLQMIFRISIGWFSASVCCQVVVSIISIFTLILGEMIQFD